MKITRTKYFGLHADRVRELAREIGRMDVVKKGELADRIRGGKTKNSFKTAWIASHQDYYKRHERRMRKVYDHLGMGNPAQWEATGKVREREKDLYDRLTKDDSIYWNNPEYRRGDYRYNSKPIRSRPSYSKPTLTSRQETNPEGTRYYRDLKGQIDDYVNNLKKTDPNEYRRIEKLRTDDPGFDAGFELLRKKSTIEELLEQIRNNK